MPKALTRGDPIAGTSWAVRCPSARAACPSGCDRFARCRAKARACGLGLPQQSRARIEQVEALTLRVLLRFRSWQRGHDGDVAAGGGGVGEPGGQQRGLYPTAAVRGRRRRAGELRDALRNVQASGADDDPVAQRDVAGAAGRREIPCGPREDLPRDLLVPGPAWGILPTPAPLTATFDDPLQNVTIGSPLWWWMCADIKVDALERWDTDVIAPVLDALDADGEPYRILLMPDHATPCNTKTHSAEPVPYLLFDSERPGAGGSYTEPATQACAPVAAYTLMGRLVAQE